MSGNKKKLCRFIKIVFVSKVCGTTKKSRVCRFFGGLWSHSLSRVLLNGLCQINTFANIYIFFIARAVHTVCCKKIPHPSCCQRIVDFSKICAFRLYFTRASRDSRGVVDTHARSSRKVMVAEVLEEARKFSLIYVSECQCVAFSSYVKTCCKTNCHHIPVLHKS